VQIRTSGRVAPEIILVIDLLIQIADWKELVDFLTMGSAEWFLLDDQDVYLTVHHAPDHP
jgi:hypothetical protein